MEYTINKLAKLAGISTRTLRHYDGIGLLSPVRSVANNYRVYDQVEIDRLQHILFYRELNVPLDEIKQILQTQDFDSVKTLENHLSALVAKQQQLDVLISTVKKTISAKKGEIFMNDNEKFEGFISKLVEDNESQHGTEIRNKYGNEAINRSNAKIKGMSKEKYTEVEALTAKLNGMLKSAFEQGDPAGELARKTCELHKKWLCYFWDSYSPEAHMGIAQMYVDDSRFAAYYDKIAPGCAVFLKDALQIYLG